VSITPSPPPNASATSRGLVSTDAQTFAGRKTFNALVEITAEGLKFPDGTTQVSAAVGGGGGGLSEPVTLTQLLTANAGILSSSATEIGWKLRRTGVVGSQTDPAFEDRIAEGGVGFAMKRTLYSDAFNTERPCFIIESSGTIASVSDGNRRSHWEAFINDGDWKPAYRANSWPTMRVQLGAGGQTVPAGGMVRAGGVVTVTTPLPHTYRTGNMAQVTYWEANFAEGEYTPITVIDDTHFSYADAGADATSTVAHHVSIETDVDLARTGAGDFSLYLPGNAAIGGTADPAGARLQVAGLVHSTSGGFKFPDGSTQTTAGGGASVFALNGIKAYYNDGPVGIGTNDPWAKLQVEGGDLALESGGEQSFIIKRSGTVGGQANPLYSFGRVTGGANGKPIFRVMYYDDTQGFEQNLWTLEGTTGIVGYPLATSRLGIGTDQPAMALDVRGAGVLTGALSVASLTSSGAISGSALTLSGVLTSAGIASSGAISGTTITGTGLLTIAGVASSAPVTGVIGATGGVLLTQIAAPGTPTLAQSTGTLASGTYGYYVSAFTPSGETPGSNAGTATNITITGPAGVLVSWAQVPGATGYYVYGRNVAGLLRRVATVTGGTSTSWLDDGSATVSGINNSGINGTGNIIPASALNYWLGDSAHTFARGFIESFYDSASIQRIGIPNGTTQNSYLARIPDSATAVAHSFKNNTTLVTAGAKLAQWCAGSSTANEKAYVGWDGAHVVTGVASGSNAITIPQGARLHLGGGSGNNYFTADASSIRAGWSIIPDPADTSTFLTLGASNARWNVIYLRTGINSATGQRLRIDRGPNEYYGEVTDGATAINHKFGCGYTFNNNGAKIAAFYPDFSVTEVMAVYRNGKIGFDSTDSSGTPGAATINKPSGKVAIAAGAASVVVTNSTVTAASIVLAIVQVSDATLTTINSVVPAAGSFTITGNAAATAATKVAFIVLN
jgi:hypothetical protein